MSFRLTYIPTNIKLLTFEPCHLLNVLFVLRISSIKAFKVGVVRKGEYNKMALRLMTYYKNGLYNTALL